jgi:hypothetical protein
LKLAMRLGKGVQRISGETFRSYIPTPPFSEYPSGHSAFSAASAEVLRLVTGSNTFGASYTIRAGSSSVEPGVAPSGSVTLAWSTFEEAADQAGLSRQYAGLHFEDSDLASRTMGRKIATVVWEKALTYFTGAGPGGPREHERPPIVERWGSTPLVLPPPSR